ncbi:hypothetical protein MUN89_06005 [Halobacillus salinarum]|uniref:SnoaL-like domain-containing protein n=1 Tax=Halobacillus salinarum TaxID=2932257 RepID=A0ABY4EN48_9BACI|nr:hypothetical protein [Halobacillus salinarum]UOQ45496.1 hypothetical protein MUN89_06005 [Halobacillus salinarum]
MNYSELRTKAFGEVFSESEYSSLRELLIQSYLFLDESNQSEAKRLLENTFGLTERELNDRTTAFRRHRSNQAPLYSTVEIAEEWVEKSNQQDIPGVIELSHSDMEILGPKGSIRGSHHLADWFKRANLHLYTIQRFAKGQHIVLEQQGTWYEDSGQIKGESIVFTYMKVSDEKVAFLARYDNRSDALQAGGLSEENLMK